MLPTMRLRRSFEARLFGFSKRGNVYLRKMLIHGARSLVLRVKRDSASFGLRLDRLDARSPKNVVVAAVANKLARIARRSCRAATGTEWPCQC